MKGRTIFSLIIVIVFGANAGFYAVTGFRQSDHGISPGCGVIEGRVLDEKGQPVIGAKVTSWVLDYPGPGRIFSTDTDTQGNFILTCAKPGRNAIHVGKEDEGYPSTFEIPFIDPKLIPVITVSEQKVSRGVEVRLGPKAGKLVGQVIDASTRKPIHEVKLT